MEMEKCPHGHDARVEAVETKSGIWAAYAYCDRRDCHWLSAPYYADTENAAKEKAAAVWNAVMGAYHGASATTEATK